jgi:Peptidase S46
MRGSSVYPDATFTLRLAFGEVKGYTEAGQKIPWATTIGGTYEHATAHENKEPFELPAIWKERKAKLNLATPFNFVNTADIIGGNSGSPVVNRAGDLVGIIFDGNIQSLVLDYIYTDQEARAVAIHSAGILEALRKVYSADRLVGELTGKK